MLKTKFKLIIYLLIIFLLFSSLSFASNETAEGDPVVVSAPIDNETTGTDGTDQVVDPAAVETEIMSSDLYKGNIEDYVFNEVLDGNAFISTTNFTLDSKEYRGVIVGDLYVSATNVKLTSTYTYSETETDLDGNPALEQIDEYALVNGDAFIVANKVVIEPGCKIEGNLFILANEVEIKEHTTIYGNLYVSANKLNFNGVVGQDLYASVGSFNTDYCYSHVFRDTHIIAKDTVLDGSIQRNAFISSDRLSIDKNFISNGNMEVTSSRFILLGEIARRS